MIQIQYASENLIPSFYEALKAVANQRIYLEMIDPPPLERVAAFQKTLLKKNGPVFYAVEDGVVVGWCDIFPLENSRQCHRGSLGMGILQKYRGKGLGRRLLEATLNKAKEFGLEKVELHVYTSNIPAVKLYKSFGFEQEGLIKKYRKLDGAYFDSLAMGKFL